MSLAGGDLTTPQRVAVWMASAPTLPSPVISQLVTSMSALIYSTIHRSRLFSQTFTRTFDGVGNMQLVLPDWPVTSIASIQQGNYYIPPSVLAPPGSVQPIGTGPGYGFRYIPWNGDLPGSPCVIELKDAFFYRGPQNVQVTYTAGYLIQNEPIVPASPGPYTVTVQQLQGIWCRDNGVTYAATGLSLSPVATAPGAGQYIPPADSSPGVYTFSSADADQTMLINYSFIPADLEEAVIQMVAERYAYRGRIGEISKSLGGQETIRYARGAMGPPWNSFSSLPPEVMDIVNSYVSVLPPAIGAPV